MYLFPQSQDFEDEPPCPAFMPEFRGSDSRPHACVAHGRHVMDKATSSLRPERRSFKRPISLVSNMVLLYRFSPLCNASEGYIQFIRRTLSTPAAQSQWLTLLKTIISFILSFPFPSACPGTALAPSGRQLNEPVPSSPLSSSQSLSALPSCVPISCFILTSSVGIMGDVVSQGGEGPREPPGKTREDEKQMLPSR